MMSRRLRAAQAVAVLLIAVGCGDATGPGGFASGFPDRLSEVNGVPAELSSLWTPADAEGRIQFYFAPYWPLWTNGSEKFRHLVLPAGTTVNTANPSSWDFPVGTMFFKTFSYRNPQGALRHVETRILRYAGPGWETVAYEWQDDQRDARRLTGRERVGVAVVREDGITLTHLIPSAADCQDCHGNAPPSFILGFNSRQLVEPHTGSTSYLGELADAGLMSAAIAAPPRVPDSTATTRDILGYVMGNCIHCHDGGRAFSQDPTVFMASIVGGPAPAGGIEIVRGQPDSSVLYRRVRDRVMPPVGVQVVDQAFVNRLRDWIGSLD